MPRKSALAALALVLSAIHLVGGPASAARSPLPTWERSYGRQLSSVAADDDGHVYVTGFKRSGRTYMVLRKYGPGGVLWTRRWKPGQADAEGVDVAIDPHGAVYLAGAVAAFHFEGGGWFLRKYSSSGALLWHRESHGWREGRTAETSAAVAVGAGRVFLAGNDYGCCGEIFRRDGWVRAYDTSGQLLWVNPFELPRLRRTNDSTEGIAVSTTGSIYVAGWIAMRRESETRTADHEVFVQRLTTSGGVVWSRVFRDHHGKDPDTATDIAVSADRLMVAAFVNGNPVARTGGHHGQARLIRLTLDGGSVWTKTWGRKSRRAAQPESVSIAGSGTTYVVGTERDPRGLNFFLRRYAPGGGLRWNVSIDKRRYLHGTAVETAPGGAYATGYASRTLAGRGADAWLWRFDG